MTLVVLVILAAMWVAVLAPPLVRSRQESRPSDSVVSFRRQLSTLQRTTPTARGAHAPLRSAGRGSRSHARIAAVPAVGARTTAASRRATVRRRRQNILSALAVVAGATLLLALGSGSRTIWYANAVAVVALAGYVGLLVQRRKLADQRSHAPRATWYRAA